MVEHIIYKQEDYNLLKKDEDTFNKITKINIVNANIVLDRYPRDLKYISLGWCFNNPLPDIQYTKIKYINFGHSYERKIPSFQNTNVKYITFIYDPPLEELQNIKLRYVSFICFRKMQLFDFENIYIKTLCIKAIFPHNVKLKNAYYLQNIYVYLYDITKYMNNIFTYSKINNKFPHKNDEGYYNIRKNLNPYMKYIIYNNIFIPFEIYNYIYINYGFTYTL